MDDHLSASPEENLHHDVLKLKGWERKVNVSVFSVRDHDRLARVVRNIIEDTQLVLADPDGVLSVEFASEAEVVSLCVDIAGNDLTVVEDLFDLDITLVHQHSMNLQHGLGGFRDADGLAGHFGIDFLLEERMVWTLIYKRLFSVQFLKVKKGKKR